MGALSTSHEPRFSLPPRSRARDERRGADEIVRRTLETEEALRWLVSMRWHAVAGQAIALFVAVVVLHLDVRVAPVALLVSFVAASNVVLDSVRRGETTRPTWWVGVVVLVDTALLTALLALSGGSDNPFVVLFLAHVAVAAFLLDKRWIIAHVALVAIGYRLLFAFRSGAPPELAGTSASALHDWSTWAALVITAAVVAPVVHRLSLAVRDRHHAFVRSQAAASRSETVASLGALAAGAAHELATPLGTIAVASNELCDLIESDPVRALDDAYLIRDEVDRCRTIIQRMAARAGDQIGELPSAIALVDLRAAAMSALGASGRERVRWIGAEDAVAFVPVHGLVQSIASLVSNALAATRGQSDEVDVDVTVDDDATVVVVADRGPGIAPALQSRLGDPFLTTKDPGDGMGLGIFLCHAFAEAWGGSVTHTGREGGGTCATLRIPHRKERG